MRVGTRWLGVSFSQKAVWKVDSPFLQYVKGTDVYGDAGAGVEVLSGLPVGAAEVFLSLPVLAGQEGLGPQGAVFGPLDGRPDPVAPL